MTLDELINELEREKRTLGGDTIVRVYDCENDIVTSINNVFEDYEEVGVNIWTN